MSRYVYNSSTFYGACSPGLPTLWLVRTMKRFPLFFKTNKLIIRKLIISKNNTTTNRPRTKKILISILFTREKKGKIVTIVWMKYKSPISPNPLRFSSFWCGSRVDLWPFNGFYWNRFASLRSKSFRSSYTGCSGVFVSLIAVKFSANSAIRLCLL